MTFESNHFYPLEPKRRDMARLGQEVLDRAIGFIEGIANRPVMPEEAPAGFITTMLSPPPNRRATSVNCSTAWTRPSPMPSSRDHPA